MREAGNRTTPAAGESVPRPGNPRYSAACGDALKPRRRSRRTGIAQPDRRHPKTLWERAAPNPYIDSGTDRPSPRWKPQAARCSKGAQTSPASSRSPRPGRSSRRRSGSPSPSRALSRTVARLEARFGGRLFERIPSGVRLTSLGALAAERAQRVLRELEAAEEQIEAAVSGLAGCFRISAHPLWMQAVLPAAIARFHDAFPGIELKLRGVARPQGIRLLTEGATDLHCGGIEAGEPLPPFLRRDSFVEVEAGIVARKGHPLHADSTRTPGSKTSPAGRGSTTTVRRRRTAMPVAGRRSQGYCTTSMSAPADGRGPSSAPLPPDRFRWLPVRISLGCR